MDAHPPEDEQGIEVESIARLLPAPTVPELSDDRLRELRGSIRAEISISRPRRRRRLIAVAATLGAVAAAVFAALSIGSTAGALDTSFGEDGKVVTEIVTDLTHGHWDDWASALALQADGKIVIAGGARYRRRPLRQRRHPRRELRQRRPGEDRLHLGIRLRPRAGHPGGRQDRRRRPIRVKPWQPKGHEVRPRPPQQRRHPRRELRRRRQGADRLHLGIRLRRRGGRPGGRQDRRCRYQPGLGSSLSPATTATAASTRASAPAAR